MSDKSIEQQANEKLELMANKLKMDKNKLLFIIADNLKLFVDLADDLSQAVCILTMHMGIDGRDFDVENIAFTLADKSVKLKNLFK